VIIYLLTDSGMDSHRAGLDGIRLCGGAFRALPAATPSSAATAPISKSYGPSLWFGTMLIAVGVTVNVFSG
jgi:energy-converting hydrogenase Eha subunit A